MNDLLRLTLLHLLAAQMKKDLTFAKSFGDLAEAMDNLFGLVLIQQKQIQMLADQIYGPREQHVYDRTVN